MARYTPDDPAFAGDFIEFSDSWSRAQVRAAWGAVPDSATEGTDDGPLLTVLRPKIVALRLTCVDAEPITQPAQLTPERSAEMDTRLYAWFASVWLVHLRSLADLGNALSGTLWPSSDTSKATKTTKVSTARHRRTR